MVGVNVVASGQNYRLSPIVKFIGGNGSGAEAICNVNDGFVVSINVTKSGSGYTSRPLVQIMPKPSKQGCGFCHLCCKRMPEQQSPKTGQTGYSPPLEERIQDNEHKINDILNQIKQLQYIQLVQKQQPSNQLDEQLMKPKTQKIQNEQLDEKLMKTKTPKIPNEQLDQSLPSKQSNQSELPSKQSNQSELQLIDNHRRALSDFVTNRIDKKHGQNGVSVFSEKEIQLLQEYNTMMNNSQLSAQEKQIRNQMEAQRIKKSIQQQKNHNWAPEGKTTQSTTYQNHGPNLAVDGNIDTYNQTNVGRSWWQVELSIPVAIRSVVVFNRLGTYQVKSRLVPFKIQIINNNGATVGEKTFENVQDKYVWDKVYIVGKIIRIELLNNNYLHMAEVEVWGEEAQDCPTYMDEYNKTNQEINKKLIQYSTIPDELTQKKTKTKSLYDSCTKMTKEDSSKRQQLFEEQVKAYDQVLSLQQKENEIKIQEAKQKQKDIKAAQAIEAQAAKQAKRFGLPPPPSRYTQAEIDEVNQNLKKYKPIVLTNQEKVQCMSLLNDATQKRNKAEDIGRIAESMPFLLPSAREWGNKSEDAWNKYNQMCQK